MLSVLVSCTSNDSGGAAGGTEGSEASSTSKQGVTSGQSVIETDLTLGACQREGMEVFFRMAGAIDRADTDAIEQLLAPVGQYSSIRTPLLQVPNSDRQQAAVELQKVRNSGQRLFPSPSAAQSSAPPVGGIQGEVDRQFSDVNGQLSVGFSTEYGHGGRVRLQIECVSHKVVAIDWIAFSS
jgi:hypothetical protein